MSEPIVCSVKTLPSNQWISSAQQAAEINPLNRLPLEQFIQLIPSSSLDNMRLSVLTTKYWRTSGVHLTVGFLDNPPKNLRKRIISHLNAWNKTARIKFSETQTDSQVRIARQPGDGHWSYIGTDILLIDPHEATMNLDSFTMQTPDSEFYRVVRHEAGHTLGCPHEHMRRELVERIDPQKAFDYFKASEGWSEEEVRQQVLMPIEEISLWGTLNVDPDSIMCYQLPGSITKDGQPILGGFDINKQDYALLGKIYPKR